MMRLREIGISWFVQVSGLANDSSDRVILIFGLSLHSHSSPKSLRSLIEKLGIIDCSGISGRGTVIHFHSVSAIPNSFDAAFHNDLGATAITIISIFYSIKNIPITIAFKVFSVEFVGTAIPFKGIREVTAATKAKLGAPKAIFRC